MIKIFSGKLVRKAVCAVMAVGVVGSCSALAAAGTVTASSGLNLRTGSGSSYPVITTIRCGANVEILDQSGSWYKVSFNGKTGFVSSEYVSVAGQHDPRTLGVINVSAVNLRSEASTASKVLKLIKNGTTVTVLDSSSDWYKVYFDGKEGYVFGEYVSIISSDPAPEGDVPEVVALSGPAVCPDRYWVNCSAVNLREGATTDSKVIVVLPGRSIVSLVEDCGEWTKVLCSDGTTTGYISSQYLSPVPADSGELALQIVVKATQYLGTPYYYGGTSPKGFDCSGFTQYVFGACGVTLDRTANDQIKNGVSVSRDSLQPGDLVFFSAGRNGIASHVGIYIGDNEFIHSANTGVIITKLDSSDYYRNSYMCAARVV